LSTYEAVQRMAKGSEGKQSNNFSRQSSQELTKVAAVPEGFVSNFGSGLPLDKATRIPMESKFRHDFGRVRVHADERSAQSALAIGARAYTVGQDIFFGAEEYKPGTASGQRLIAHELTHTVQQAEAATVQGSLRTGLNSDSSEAEARRASGDVLGQERVEVRGGQPLMIQREPLPEKLDLAESADPFMASAIGSVTIEGFVTDKADVSPENKQRLAVTTRTILTLLKKYPGSTIRVIGHTDAVGAEAHNVELGQKRADSTRDAIVSLGVPADQILTESRGEADLLVKTERQEPRNRRVEVRFEPKSMPNIRLIPESRIREPAPNLLTPQGPGALGRFTPDILRYRPPPQAPGKTTLPPWFWDPKFPPPLKRGGKSVSDVFSDFAHTVTDWLPKEIRGPAHDAVQAALEKGTISGLDSVLETMGVGSDARGAITKAAEAALKQKIE
jgi:outer membrane protein OmpA-like peptidoglycan-associated protein